MTPLNTTLSRRDFLLGSAAMTGVCVCCPLAQGAQEKPITKVHVVFKTHLDIGFTKLAADVIRGYMEDFIPRAMTLAETMRETHPDTPFRWTTGSWLIDKFLGQADAPNRKRMEQAIEAGDMNWHALPFTLHSEALDGSLFDLCTTLSARLDRQFNRKTLAAKMTDVPGHTRSIVPRLEGAGIEFLHIGVNPASTPPAVPPVFLWQAPDGSSVTVMYQKDYGGVMRIPYASEAVAILLTGDNHGPQRAEDVIRVYDQLKTQFPGAAIVASDLNDVAHAILKGRSRLPVVTSELGDTWIHGVGSDPRKMSQCRELSRLRRTWLQSGDLKQGSTEDLAFGIPLAMIAEHTWGLDIKTFLKTWDVYTPQALSAARATEPFKRAESSWQEKRAYVQTAIDSLPGNLKDQAHAAMDRLEPVWPETGRFTRITNPNTVIDTAHFSTALDPATGALRKLQNLNTGRAWASPDHLLALFAYQTFSQADYDRFMDQYLTHRYDWALKDFGKPGMETFKPLSRTTLPRLKSAWRREDETAQIILVELEVLDGAGHAVPGCPERLTTEYAFSNTEPVLNITCQWFDKQATRLPEALWLSFSPQVETQGIWVLDKMGQDVDPRDVIKDGARKLHALEHGIRYSDAHHSLTINTWDAPLVAPGERSLLNFDNALPAAEDGMHVCLGNNVWGTNFVMWFDHDMKFRFTLRG
ncbi:MAG: DUF5054 domain-containing protein [Phycisphaerae bacterium]|nr:DUF5054 domain-containing protein [Phycisphaerae bacterium]